MSPPFSMEQYSSLMISPYAKLLAKATGGAAHGATQGISGIGIQLNSLLAQAGALEMLGAKAANGSEQAKAFLKHQVEKFEQGLDGLKEVEQAKTRLLQAQANIAGMYAKLAIG